MKRVTIKDLAKLLGISSSTVSRALSDHPDISEATKQRVKDAAREFNYTTNIHAQFFRKQDSGLIALVLPEINMFFTPNLIKGINQNISTSKYSLITFLSDDSYEREKEIVQQCQEWAVKGLLISLSNQTHDLGHLNALLVPRIKCVLLDKILESDQFLSVAIDSVEASNKAVSHLIHHGHRNILGVFGNPNLGISQERIKGYKMAHQNHNIPVANENIISIDEQAGLDAILPTILKFNHNISAIFAMSDEVLSKSLYHIGRLGISIPQDLSIISISDGVYPYLSNPRISHILDSGKEMGLVASRLILDHIKGNKETEHPTQLVPTKLIELDSVKTIS